MAKLYHDVLAAVAMRAINLASEKSNNVFTVPCMMLCPCVLSSVTSLYINGRVYSTEDVPVCWELFLKFMLYQSNIMDEYTYRIPL